jgi:hypothetical protein
MNKDQKEGKKLRRGRENRKRSATRLGGDICELDENICNYSYLFYSDIKGKEMIGGGAR